MGCTGAAWYGREDICSQIVAALGVLCSGLFPTAWKWYLLVVGIWVWRKRRRHAATKRYSSRLYLSGGLRSPGDVCVIGNARARVACWCAGIVRFCRGCFRWGKRVSVETGRSSCVLGHGREDNLIVAEPNHRGLIGVATSGRLAVYGGQGRLLWLCECSRRGRSGLVDGTDRRGRSWGTGLFERAVFGPVRRGEDSSL